MDFWTILRVVGYAATYAVAGGMLSLFVIGTVRGRRKGIVADLTFAALLVALPLVLGFSDPEKIAAFGAWAVSGAVALVYGVRISRPDEAAGEDDAEPA